MLGEFCLGLGDRLDSLALELGDAHRFGEQLAGLQLGRKADSKLGHAHSLSERNALILAERLRGLGRGFRESLEVLDLVAPVGESGDALLRGETLLGGEKSGEGEGELFQFHCGVLVWCWVVSVRTRVVYNICDWKLERVTGF